MAIVFRLNENNLKNYRYIGRNLASPKGLVYDKIVLSRIKALSIKERANAMSEKDVTIKVES